MTLHFTKMHALGNDFIVIDDRGAHIKDLPQLSKKLCHRRFGIGADQLLLLHNSKVADFKMHIFNPDGTEAEMCGNGIRCLAKYIWDKKVRSQKSEVRSKILPYPPLLKGGKGGLTIETLAGIIHLEKKGALIRVDMGEPILEPEKIPISLRVTHYALRVINYPLKIEDKTFKITCLSMGNPHTVIQVKDIEHFPVSNYGPIIERHEIFPNRTNVEFIKILNRKNIKIRVWERGTGETMACGTGAGASAVAGALLGMTDRKVTVHLLGGKLIIEWARNNHVYMTGPAVKVFEGTVEI